MKATKKVLVSIVVAMLLTVAACGDKVPSSSENNLTTNSPMVQPGAESTSEKSTTPPTPPSTPDPASTPVPQNITYDEAVAIVSNWLSNHADVATDANYGWYDPIDIPPPTYSLFDEPYYEIVVSREYTSDWTSGYMHTILVHAETGELLSLFSMKADVEPIITTVEPLDDWYSGEQASYIAARLSVDEAIAVYDAWLGNHDDLSQYRLDVQSYEKYVILGEQYYFFHAEADERYWYNILVHMKTGELLYMMTSDGMYSETVIERIDDWYRRIKAP